MSRIGISELRLSSVYFWVVISVLEVNEVSVIVVNMVKLIVVWVLFFFFGW